MTKKTMYNKTEESLKASYEPARAHIKKNGGIRALSALVLGFGLFLGSATPAFALIGNGTSGASAAVSVPAASVSATASNSAYAGGKGFNLKAKADLVKGRNSYDDSRRDERDYRDSRWKDRRWEYPQPVKNEPKASTTVAATTSVSLYDRIASSTAKAEISRASGNVMANLAAGIGFRNPKSAAGSIDASASSASNQYGTGMQGTAAASATLGAFGFGLLGAIMAAGKFTLFG